MVRKMGRSINFSSYFSQSEKLPNVSRPERKSFKTVEQRLELSLHIGNVQKSPCPPLSLLDTYFRYYIVHRASYATQIAWVLRKLIN